GDTSFAVAVSGIARRFGHRWALRDASLHVEPGTVAALVGHNGSGKTTLLRIIATTLRPTRGSGSVFGHDLVREADGIRELVAVLGHTPASTATSPPGRISSSLCGCPVGRRRARRWTKR